MCKAATCSAPKLRTASAAHTAESIPPERETTVEVLSLVSICTWHLPLDQANRIRWERLRIKAQTLWVWPNAKCKRPTAEYQHRRNYLHSLHLRLPYELVDLQAEARGDVIFQHPLRQLARVNNAMRNIP